jgi:hypothetical protein
VANPIAYGRGPYGTARYGGYPSASAGRPYGIRAYGTGPYSRYGVGNTYLVGAATGITFTPHAVLHATIQPMAVSSISFGAWVRGSQATLQPAAVSGIVFSAWTHMTLSWAALGPCETGTWQPAAPCEGGAWQPPAGCSAGTWTNTRLETLP